MYHINSVCTFCTHISCVPLLSTRFPANSNCPDTSAYLTIPIKEDNPAENYFFPDFDADSCGHGRNYPVSLSFQPAKLLYCTRARIITDPLIDSFPHFLLKAWMGQEGYSQWYLFIDPKECCSTYFPDSSNNCPYEKTPQTGYYWETYYDDKSNNALDIPIFYNHTYYPDLATGTCINGTDYPSWMIKTDDYTRMYIFHEPQDCCGFWFGQYDENSGCVASVVQSSYESTVTVTNMTAVLLEKWYPDLYARKCLRDQQMPAWMLGESFRDYYLFDTREACCGSFGYC